MLRLARDKGPLLLGCIFLLFPVKVFTVRRGDCGVCESTVFVISAIQSQKQSVFVDCSLSVCVMHSCLVVKHLVEFDQS